MFIAKFQQQNIKLQYSVGFAWNVSHSILLNHTWELLAQNLNLSLVYVVFYFQSAQKAAEMCLYGEGNPKKNKTRGLMRFKASLSAKPYTH